MGKPTDSYKRFTLIEILVVVALITILAAISIIIINPAKHFAEAKDAQRSSDVAQMLNAVTKYTSEQGKQLGDLGTVPACTGTPAVIGSSGVDLGATLVDEYIVAIPTDPDGGTEADTGYTICQTAGGGVQINATGENDAISVSRDFNK